MLFIVIHHFIVHAVFPESLDVTTPMTAANMSATIANGFLFIAVNCFVLISGYFGINLKTKSILNLYLTCVFYKLIAYVYLQDIAGVHIDFSLIDVFFVFSHRSWWFIKVYVILLLFSPLLNMACRYMNQRQHRFVLFIFLLMQVYFGNIWQTLYFDSDGYHAFNFIFIYLVGRYLHRYVSSEKIDSYRWHNFGLYVICAIFWAGLTILDHIYPMDWWHGWTYNNVFTLAGALFFFCFIQSFHFHSKLINWLAVSTLSVYLVQSKWLYRLIEKSCAMFGNSLTIKWLYILLMSISFFVVVLLFDKIRYYIFQWFFSWPITKKVMYKCDKVFAVFEKK